MVNEQKNKRSSHNYLAIPNDELDDLSTNFIGKLYNKITKLSDKELNYDNIIEVLGNDKDAQGELAKLKKKFFSTTKGGS